MHELALPDGRTGLELREGFRAPGQPQPGHPAGNGSRRHQHRMAARLDTGGELLGQPLDALRQQPAGRVRQDAGADFHDQPLNISVVTHVG